MSVYGTLEVGGVTYKKEQSYLSYHIRDNWDVIWAEIPPYWSFEKGEVSYFCIIIGSGIGCYST